MKSVRRWSIAVLALLALCAAVLAVAHPWFAVTERSGGKVMVVEGWMDEERLAEAAQLFKTGGYERLYTTGTTRPFVYYLMPGEWITARFASEHVEHAIGVAGLPNCSVQVIAGEDTVLDVPTTDSIVVHSFRTGSGQRMLEIRARPIYPQPGPPSVFIHSFTASGRNVHALNGELDLYRVDTTYVKGRPSYADESAAVLASHGIPSNVITPVPAGGDPISRSWANAETLAKNLGRKGITALDVVTLGVHARRSRALYREALGEEVNVGVIALADPDCTADGWWRSAKGRYTLFKEILGSQEAAVVDATR